MVFLTTFFDPGYRSIVSASTTLRRGVAPASVTALQGPSLRVGLVIPRALRGLAAAVVAMNGAVKGSVPIAQAVFGTSEASHPRYSQRVDALASIPGWSLDVQSKEVAMIRTSVARPLIVRTLVDCAVPSGMSSPGTVAGRSNRRTLSFWPVESPRTRGRVRFHRPCSPRPGLAASSPRR
jgi:hypothetical protein